MNRKTGLIIIMMLFSAALNACSSGAGDQILTDADHGQTIEMNVGDTFSVELESNPSTGYSWQVAAMDNAVLKQIGQPEFKPESDQVGAGGIEILRFETVGRGQSILKLIYHRPWDQDVPPLETYEVRVVVK